MIVTRFMSRGEFGKLMAGEKLVNTKRHHDEDGRRSESVGFCFTEEEPMTAFEYLYGIVDADVWVTFDFPDGYLTESGGIYADKTGESATGLVRKREWCCTEYSLDIASVIKMDANFKYDGHQQINSAVDAFLGMYEAIVELEQKTGLKLL